MISRGEMNNMGETVVLMPHDFNTSGELHASTGVPPQQLSTRPIGIYVWGMWVCVWVCV